MRHALTVLFLWHDCVTQGQQYEEVPNVRVFGLNCSLQLLVVKLERCLRIRVAREVDWHVVVLLIKYEILYKNVQMANLSFEKL